MVERISISTAEAAILTEGALDNGEACKKSATNRGNREPAPKKPRYAARPERNGAQVGAATHHPRRIMKWQRKKGPRQ